ncbi:hypothetical protein [Tatumella sp. UBA2305]|uniref:hypothetical protein n=1 Tax=Tatumella sp. UBA2305 TaxID=1947647 RepID=UPI0025EA773B|nr:hypothetical protein [Tatumella sp. UBA2305]
METRWRESGKPEEVRRYPDPGASVLEKTWYQNGQLSYEGLGFDGNKYLKAVAINGMSDVRANDDQSILQNPNALISELTWFGKQAAPGEPATGSKYAHQLPASAFSQGFPLMMKNTAEFAMIHHPVIE